MSGGVLSGRSVQSPAPLGNRPTASHRPFDASQPGNASRPGTVGSRPSSVPPHRSSDVRYSRPASSVVRPHPHAHHRPPVVHTYRGWYTRWYCHPYYRFHYSTVAVVGFGFGVYAWHDYWVPPARHGWAWSSGYWSWGYWNPGFWRPIAVAPVGYRYVPGWWEADAYVEGYYRAEGRDGWSWVDGYYLDGGTYIRGHWMPTGPAPEGYTWVAGFWDGNESIDGFWRPEHRRGYQWVSGYYDEDGVFEAGYWLPVDELVGSIWIPGWFDGNTWVDGYWVDEQEYYATDLDSWQPEEGYDDGWEIGTGWGDGEVVDDRSADPPTAQLIQRQIDETGEAPLAVPVAVPVD